MMSTDDDDRGIKGNIAGFQNQAFEGDDGDVDGVFEDINLKDSPETKEKHAHAKQNGGWLHQNSGSRKQNGGSLNQNGGSSNQNGGSTHQNGGPLQQNGGHMDNHNSEQQNGRHHQPSQKHKHSNKTHPSSHHQTNGNSSRELPVVFVGGRAIEVRHESQNVVRTTGTEAIGNAVYDEGDKGSEGLCCTGRCLLCVVLVLILMALVAVILCFILLPREKLSEVQVVVVLDIQYIPEYDDPSTTEYKKLVNDYTIAMNQVFLESDRSEQYNGVEVVKLSAGSVRVNSVVRWLIKSSLIDENDVHRQADEQVGLTVLEAVMSNNMFGNLPVNDAWIVTEIPSDPPVLKCPSDISAETDPKSSTTKVTWPSPDVIDNAGVVSLMSDHQAGSEFSIGRSEVTYTARDPSGNIATCTFTVNVIDAESPVVICPPNVYLVSPDGKGTAQIGEALWQEPIIHDNSRQTMPAIFSVDPTTEFHLGVTEVMITASDYSGNDGSCNFSVTVEGADTEPPQLTCPEDITTFAFSGATSRQLTWETPKVTDNSGRDVQLESNHQMWSMFPIGSTEVVYTATDFVGNTATCSFFVNVQDRQPPYLQCPDDAMVTLPQDATTVAVLWTEPTVSDNSGTDVALSVSHQPGSTFPSGVTRVTYTARDIYANERTCEFKVVVEDPKCGPPYVTLAVNQPYTINSTNYPEHYTSITDCTWILIVPPDTRVVVMIKDFKTEYWFDFVKIGGSSSDRDPPSDKEVDRFEGDVEPTRYVINNATVWMTFFADRGTTFTGFSIEFLAIYTEALSECESVDFPLISKEICDGVVHCPDSSDETVCICSDNEFQCDDGICMPGSVMCNDVNDCGDYSDERYCPPCSDDMDLKCVLQLPYSQTYYPNDIAMTSQEAANNLRFELSSAILDVCHPKAYLLVCAAIYPECPHNGPQRAPCNELCQEVSLACADAWMRVVGSDWPVNCERYGLDNDDNGDGLCDTVEGDIFHTGICGTRPAAPIGARIVGGVPSALGTWPWIASLRDPTSSTNHKCGGSLIGDRWVLTAAHCVGHFEEVYVGGLLVSSPSSTEEMFLVADAFPHPDYDVLNNEYDFAVVQLSRTVNFTDYIRPICLATSQVELLTYHSCYIAGWGTTRYDGPHSDNLQEALVPMIPRDTCAEYYSNRDAYEITDKMVCAGYEEGRIDACQGDSGGPLMCLSSDNRWHIVGVTSFGDRCAQSFSPGVYTRVSQLESFISGVVQQVEDCYTDGGYICTNNRCISHEMKCDYRFDCADGEDEQNCHHICSREGLISLDENSLIEIRLENLTDSAHIYCLWGFQAPPGYRIVLRAREYYRWYYIVEVGEGLDPNNASSVVRKLPGRRINVIAHFTVTSSQMWVTLSRERIYSHPLELHTMLDVFLVQEDELTPCLDVRGEVVFKSAVCDGKADCTNESDERNCN